MVAKTFWGLEEVLAQELKTLGAQNVIVGNRAVEFQGNLLTLYRANLWSRTALRILCAIHSFSAQNEDELYHGVQSIDWQDYMEVGDTFAVDSVVNSETFTHSRYVALKTKDAIVDQFRDRLGRRPFVNVKTPDLQVHIHIAKQQCNLLIDSSGEPLYKRGYRKNTGGAPLNEVLAAGLLELTGWQGDGHFVDPMCGSGTLLCEAALKVCRKAPGLLRESFGFMRWQNFDTTQWERLCQEAQKIQREPTFKFVGSDYSARVLEYAAENIERAGLDEYISLSRKDFMEKVPPTPSGNSIVVTNPPYGERLQPEDVVALHRRFGDALKQHYQGYTAWILSGNKEAIARVGLRTFRKHSVMNGAIPCKFHGYQLFKGSWKDKTEDTPKPIR